MRLDKYLKVSRLIKRRTVANEACDAGRVLLNDKVARASADVKIGDVIEIQFGTRNVKVEVLSIQDSEKKEAAAEMYKYLLEITILAHSSILLCIHIKQSDREKDRGAWKKRKPSCRMASRGRIEKRAALPG